jgi:hypothetical protein
MIIIKYYQPPMLDTNRRASNRLNYYAVGLASCRFLVDTVEVRDMYTNEMRSHSHYPFSPLDRTARRSCSSTTLVWSLVSPSLSECAHAEFFPLHVRLSA